MLTFYSSDALTVGLRRDTKYPAAREENTPKTCFKVGFEGIEVLF